MYVCKFVTICLLILSFCILFVGFLIGIDCQNRECTKDIQRDKLLLIKIMFGIGFPSSVIFLFLLAYISKKEDNTDCK